MTARLIIAGTHSGVGKTTITAGLIAALVRRRLAIQPFKVGPDYIDPTFHALAAGRPCRNLDAWLVPPERLARLFAHHAARSELAIIEGVMGLFDGCGYDDETGSTAQVAKLLGAPVVVVIDAARMARSAAAFAVGCLTFDPQVPLAGFIVNRVGSERHGEGVARAIEQTTGKPVFGWLARDPRLAIAERQLGLIPTIEPGAWHAFIDAAADTVARQLDLDRLLAMAQAAPTLNVQQLNDDVQATPSDGPRPIIAVARDEAFHFTYEENLELLAAAGAELRFFSPLIDRGLPEGTSAILLSGGFPEHHAARLASNRSMHTALRESHAARLPIYAECGGLMYLTDAIVDAQGRRHPMVGLLGGEARMGEKLSLGYRQATAAADGWLLDAGQTLRGHEFHYSAWVDRPADLPPAYLVTTADGRAPVRPEGASFDNLWASYIHVHFFSQPEVATRFVAAAREASARPAEAAR